MAAKKAMKKAAGKIKAKAKAARAKVAKKAGPKKVDPVPKGYHSITPSLTIKDCSSAIDFYKRALGAREVSRMDMPGTHMVWHAELKVGDSLFFVADEMPGMGPPAPSKDRPSPASCMIYVKDADGLFNQAVGAGCTVTMPMTDQFWGDRMGMVLDPYGYAWAIAKRVRNMSEREMEEAGKAFATSQAGGGAGGPPPPSAGSTGMGGPGDTGGGSMPPASGAI